jgi:hypothetical protein
MVGSAFHSTFLLKAAHSCQLKEHFRNVAAGAQFNAAGK